MNRKVVALVDCNNFYVSCERAFHVALQNKPVVVLSNNDGCVVARSNESKKLGIKMGQPYFQCQDIIRQHNVQVFSSNYSLYADMSARVMQLLSQFASVVEVYSIDEAFLDLSSLAIDDLSEFGRTLKASIMQSTGIPVSVGIAATKTLAKGAVEIAKKDPLFEGVLDITGWETLKLDALLEGVAIEDVWGIGRTYALFLNNYGIQTAKDLKYADRRWIRRHLTVTGERIVLELAGTACLPVETQTPPKKGIMCAKTFGRDITSEQELQEAVATYTVRAAEKLRQQDSLAAELSVFIQTDHFKTEQPQYANSMTMELASPTAYTPELISNALHALHTMYRPDHCYKKAGVALSHITSGEVVQPDLFGTFSMDIHQRQERLMFIVDAINRIYGPNTLFFAVQGSSRSWAMRQRRLSPRVTTRWNEILTV